MNYIKKYKSDDYVIFLHGWGGNKYSFYNLYNYLYSYNMSVISVDLSGFGDNPPLEKIYTIYDYANDLKNFLKTNNLDNFCVVCHSFGARLLPLIYDDFNIKKIVITGGAGLKEKFSISKTKNILEYKFKKFLCHKFGLDKKILAKYGSDDYKSLDNNMKQTFINIVNTPLNREYKKIKSPTLLFWGKDDKITPLYMAKKFNKLIQNSQLIIVEGGHFCYIENDFVFCNKVLDFFKGE